uniref:Uncharacterized protein n=1 Tax=Oryza brachyantha TaxID=4533 RepID=J3N6R0_ORYBR
MRDERQFRQCEASAPRPRGLQLQYSSLVDHRGLHDPVSDMHLPFPPPLLREIEVEFAVLQTRGDAAGAEKAVNEADEPGGRPRIPNGDDAGDAEARRFPPEVAPPRASTHVRTASCAGSSDSTRWSTFSGRALMRSGPPPRSSIPSNGCRASPLNTSHRTAYASTARRE